MCTCIAMRKNRFLFGRNMDIDYSFGEQVIITPRNFPLTFKNTEPLGKHYAIIGMAAEAEGYPLYAEGINENGLCIAALKFPRNARYAESSSTGKTGIAPFELIPWVLGKCRNLTEARTLLAETEIVNIPFSNSLPVSPLHWMISDSSSSLVLECTESGIEIYDNPTDVLTNNPPFPAQLQNLTKFSHLKTDFNPENAYSLGLGAVGLPGDFSSVSRFARADFLLKNTPESENPVSDFFHVLDNLAVPRGAVITPDGKYHFTTYSCCMDIKEQCYYFRTCHSGSIFSVRLTPEASGGSRIISFKLPQENNFRAFAL